MDASPLRMVIVKRDKYLQDLANTPGVGSRKSPRILPRIGPTRTGGNNGGPRPIWRIKPGSGNFTRPPALSGRRAFAGARLTLPSPPAPGGEGRVRGPHAAEKPLCPSGHAGLKKPPHARIPTTEKNTPRHFSLERFRKAAPSAIRVRACGQSRPSEYLRECHPSVRAFLPLGSSCCRRKGSKTGKPRINRMRPAQGPKKPAGLPVLLASFP